MASNGNNNNMQSGNVTVRKKQPSLPEIQTTDDYVTETRMRDILKHELKYIMQGQVDQLSSMNEQMAGFHKAFEFFNAQFEDMKKCIEEKNAEIDQLKSENIQLKSDVRDLTARLSSVEQHMRESNVEINGIPEHRNENLIETMMTLAKSIDGEIVRDDIIHVTRVAKIINESSRPRPVIVKLRTPRHRDEVLAAVAKHNRKNPQEKLCTKHLGFNGTPSPVFVSEHLSPTNKKLHAATRKKAKELSYKFVWVRNGRVFIRKDVNYQATIIKDLESLNHIKASSE